MDKNLLVFESCRLLHSTLTYFIYQSQSNLYIVFLKRKELIDVFFINKKVSKFYSPFRKCGLSYSFVVLVATFAGAHKNGNAIIIIVFNICNLSSV